MEQDNFPDLIAHRHDRVQRSHGILEDHGDLSAADLAHLLFRILQKVLTLEFDRSGGDLPRRVRDEPHDAQSRRSLAGTGLAYQADTFALIQ